MLGPVVDIELVDPDKVIPDGVVIDVANYLTVPTSTEIKETVEANTLDIHTIVKLTRNAEDFDVKTFGANRRTCRTKIMLPYHSWNTNL